MDTKDLANRITIKPRRKPVITTEFTTWLQDEMNRRNWSYADLARAAGVTRAMIGSMMRSGRGPGKKTLAGIAKAFNLPQEIVYQKAGYMEDVAKYSERAKLIAWLSGRLDPYDQQEVIEFIEMKLKRAEQRDLAEEFSSRYKALPPERAAEVLRKILQIISLIEKR